MSFSSRFTLVFLSLFVLLLSSHFGAFVGSAQSGKSGTEYIVYFGTYTGPDSKGIYAWRFSPVTGNLSSLGVVAETKNPSFLALHPDRRHLYAVGESGDGPGPKSGSVSAFSIDSASGKLTLLNTSSSGGGGPCHVVVDKTGRAVLVANYGSGSVAALPLQADGRLGEAAAFVQHSGSSVNPDRQKGPHAHSINLSPDNRFAVAADLGLDKLLVYRFDPVRCSLTPHEPPYAAVKAGAGPRHFAFHPEGRFAYVINELQSTITGFRYEATTGTLEEIQTVSTLPGNFAGENTTAEVQVHPSGKFLYGSNRGHDSIAVFAVDRLEGTLTPIQHVPTQGKTPRNFGIDPGGQWLFAANQKSNNVVVFRINSKNGRLAAAGKSFAVPSPVCVRFAPVR